MNLRLKLFLSFTIMFTVIFCLSTFHFIPSYTSYLQDEQLTHETAQVEHLSAALTPDIIKIDMQHTTTSMDAALAKRKHWHSLELLNQSGKQLHLSQLTKIPKVKNLTTISSNILAKGETHSTMVLNFDPAPHIEKPISHAHFFHYSALVVLVLAFLTMYLFLDRYIRQPMIKLVKFADQIARGDYQSRSPINLTDEVGQLSKSLEIMRQKVHQRDVAMNHDGKIQETIRFIQSKFISIEDDKHIFLDLQNKILALTNSKAGFIGEINTDKSLPLSCNVLSLSDISNDYPHYTIVNKTFPKRDTLPTLETLLGQVMITGRPVMDNGPDLSINRLGFSVYGQPTVDNFLGLPLYSNNQLIGVLGLVNKENGFDLTSVKALETLLQTLAQLIVARRERKVLTDNENRLRLLISSAIEGIISANGDGIITGVNKAAERIFGYSTEQLLGQSVGLLVPPENHFNHLDTVHFLLASENNRTNTEIETDALHRNGKLIPVELSFSKITIDGEVQYSGVVRDITERKQYESEINRAYAELQKAHELLEEQNRIDSLTRLANRRHLDETLKSEWKRAQRLDNSPLTIMLCDIDYFKKYNDAYGHLEGDDCLVQIAKVMSESFTRKIDLVARYGGEEFMILLPNTSAVSAIKQAEIMCNRIWDLDIKHQSSPIADRVTISIGIHTIQPTFRDNLRKTIQCTDEALYQAKDNGRNQIFRYEQIDLNA